MTRLFNLLSRQAGSILMCVLLCLFVACNHGPAQPSNTSIQAGAKRYPFKGKVVSVDKQAGTANIENEPIAGFMDAMVMGYPLQPPTALDQLQPGDSITADVVVGDPGKYWLENVKVIGRSKSAATNPSM